MELTISDLKPFLPGLEAALDDEAVLEVMINGPGVAFVERAGRMAAVDVAGTDHRSRRARGSPDRPPAGQGPEHGADHRRASCRRFPRRHLRPAGRADGCDHHPPLGRPGLHCRGTDRERFPFRRLGRRGRGRARSRAQPADLGRHRLGQDDAAERPGVAAAGRRAHHHLWRTRWSSGCAAPTACGSRRGGGSAAAA